MVFQKSTMESMVKSLLITGASGFVGTNLLEELVKIEEIQEIHVLAHNKEKMRIRNKKIKIHSYENYFNNRLEFIEKPEFIVHLASAGVKYNNEESEKEIFKVNIELPFNLLKKAKEYEIENFINFGSCFEYGKGGENIKENESTYPFNLYSLSKTTNIQLLNGYTILVGSKIVTLRPFGLFGKYENPNRLIPALINAGIKSEPMYLTPGEQIRDYIYVKNLVEAIILILKNGIIKNKEIYNICSGEGKSLIEIVELITKKFNFKKELYKFGEKEYRKNEIMKLIGNPDKFKNDYNFENKISLEKGLEETYFYIKNNNLGEK